MNKFSGLLVVTLLIALQGISQVVQVGSGSYTKTFPGYDVLGRNAIPTGTPFVSGNAVGKPVPTSDWWTALVKNGQASNLFNHPFTMKTNKTGLVVTYIPSGVIDDIEPVTVGVAGMDAPQTTVSGYSDWTVTMDWKDANHHFETTSGLGMPFLYFTKGDTDIAQVTVASGTVTISDEMLVISNARNGADFAVYAPAGSTWIKNGNTYTSTLNGKNYWSLAFIPLTATDVAGVATEYKKYAYVFPVKTTATYSYNEATSVIRTEFNVTTDVKEGNETKMLLGLLPHQWSHLSADSPVPDKYSYAIIRGEMKTLAGNSFTVENTFHGILPTLPYVDNYSSGFTPTALNEKIKSIENNELASWTDSYNEGQVMNQLIQTARIADQTGNVASRDKILSTIKNRLENWLTYNGSEVAFLFYYNTIWSAFIGYPAGYGQDAGLNDRHFHWGYFIHAAAFIEQYQPGWASQWGGMVKMLVRDVASSDRNDAMFPYLRNFNPYSGQSWADGFANNPQGNNQESSSESMVFNSSLIHWGQLTADKAIRDLGIYLYTTEQTAIEEYYMDIHHRNFPASQQYSLVSRVWGNKNDNGTFWTSDIAASYGIELYPIHGGSLYLGQDTLYVKRLWDEIAANTGILSNQANPNLWHDIMWEYLSFIDPAKAITLYNSYPDRDIKFGVADAQTYHWLHAMNALGRVNASVTADYPIAAAFIQHGKNIYVAQNYSNSDLTVTFSTGYKLLVPAGKMATSIDVKTNGTLTASFSSSAVNGSVVLQVSVTGGMYSKIEFMDGSQVLGSVVSGALAFTAANLQLGKHNFYARIYDGDKFNVTNIIEVLVGNQVSYNGSAWEIPGTIEAGKFDIFEGGNGQNICYFDATLSNAGDFRTEEYVDVTADAAEGATVGYVTAGEWLEYTVNVTQAGLYSFAFRYASGNPSGGGPFHLELDGVVVSGDIPVPSTSSTVWSIWATKTITNIPLTPGIHVLRLSFSNGEFNLGKLTFTRTGNLAYSYPVAVTAGRTKVLFPQNSATIDGSGSYDSEGNALNFEWTQNYGPSTVQFSDALVPNPVISGLVEGIYSFSLTVTNPDLRSDSEDLLVLVSSQENVKPIVSLISPMDGSAYVEGTEIGLSATASDFDGIIQKVDFYSDNTLISSDETSPYTAFFTPVSGNYALTAKATDNGGATGTSQAVNVTVNSIMSCTEVSDAATEGAFAIGYKCTFETIGSNVTVTFELLDAKTGVVAYLRKANPFTEMAMTKASGKIFSVTLSGQTPGETLSNACKFAFAGGLAVTKYISYVVGSNCGSAGTDTESPAGFTATVGDVTGNSVEILLQATDNSGTVIYNVSNSNTNLDVSVASGVLKSYLITGLTANTNYTFAVTAKDITGNTSSNSPITLNVTTAANTNTECSGTLSTASQGSFSTGYKYSFATTGTDVKITFELLDDKAGVIAYLWKQTPFAESAMTLVSGKTFTKTITGQSIGSTINYACKFAFAGGMSVTKYLSYVVGNNCVTTGIDFIPDETQKIYPNPVKKFLNLQLKRDENHLVITDAIGRVVFNKPAAAILSIDMSKFDKGIYFLTIQNEDGIQKVKIIKD